MSASGERPSVESFAMELRRGAIVLCVLHELEQEQYGYSLKQHLAERGLAVHEGTLYPLLRRLEAQGLLTSRWQAGGTRPRRYYRISTAGRLVRRRLSTDWRSITAVVDGFIAATDRTSSGTAS